MTKLTCHVTSCASNCDSCCCRPSIKVQGKGACKCSETECQSFERKGVIEMFNGVGAGSANPSCEVRCTADNCRHNSHGSCTAAHIDIEGMGADVRSQTNCSSFQAR